MKFIAEFLAGTGLNSVMFAWCLCFSAINLFTGQYVLAGIMAILALFWGNRVFNPPYTLDPYDD